MKLSVLVFLLCAFNHGLCYNILLFFNMPVKSLSLLAEGYVKHLLQAGHNVTYVTAFPSQRTDKNLRQIDVSSVKAHLQDSHMLNLTLIMSSSIEMNSVQDLQTFAVDLARLTFENENIKKFLQNKNEKFDAVIIELYETEVYSGLAALYDCPLIWAYSMGAHWNVLDLVDEATNPAYTTDYRSVNTLPLNFLQRIDELWWQIKASFIKRFITAPKEEFLYREVFKPLFEGRGKPMPRYEDVVYNASLMLSNEHATFGNLPSIPQNFKFIAGQHIDTPKPLSEELQTLMDNAKHGVVYFSLGSTWQSKYIPESVTRDLLKMFGELKQTVIWKYEANLKKLPKNVHILNWAPQHSILAHRNCAVFITHGGLLSTLEALHFAVPIIGVPIFFDQFVNINKAVANGYALKTDLTFDMAKDLKNALNTILSTDRFKQRVKELSEIYHDRVVPPGKELVYWINHVVRTRGAPHLRSPALLTPFYQKMYLDLAAVVIVALLIVSYTMRRFLSKKPKALRLKKTN